MGKKAYLVDDYLMQSSGIGAGEDIEGPILREAGFEYIKTSCYSEDDIIARCADADVVMDLGTKIGTKTMDALKNCKGYLRYGIGFDVLDVAAATERGVMICNMPHYCVDEVATQALTLALAASRQLFYQCSNTKKGVWYTEKLFPMHSNRFCTFGFLGFGNIARKASAFAKPFGFRLIASDPWAPASVFEEYGVKSVSKRELLAESDFISVHTPLNDETFHILDREDFAAMKDGVIIVNTSRGPTVSTDALAEALASGKVAAAGLDVVEGEPLKDDSNPLLKLDNVLITPHSAYDTVEATLQLRREVAKTAVAILKGEVPFNVVNRKALGLS